MKHQVSRHTAAGHSPGHIVSTASSTIELDDRGPSVRVLHQHEGTEPYAFINGQVSRPCTVEPPITDAPSLIEKNLSN